MSTLRDRVKQLRRSEERDNDNRLRDRVLPMAAFYGRSPEQEAERRRAYNDCARAFRDWSDVDPRSPDAVVDHSAEPTPMPGNGGRGRDITAIERNRVIAINQNSSPFEWLAAKGHLETRDDPAGISNARFSAGLRPTGRPGGRRTIGTEDVRSRAQWWWWRPRHDLRFQTRLHPVCHEDP